jgi:hypothetical protein
VGFLERGGGVQPPLDQSQLPPSRRYPWAWWACLLLAIAWMGLGIAGLVTGRLGSGIPCLAFAVCWFALAYYNWRKLRRRKD